MTDYEDIEDRIAGCLVGGAIGDGLGRAFEGRDGAIDVDLTATQRVSDDTQMTLATCEAILSAGRVDPAITAERFAAWFRARRITGVGASTMKALQELVAGQHWALAGAKGDRSAGNGAAMRIAPLAFFCDPGDDEDRRLIRDVCRITHHNDEAYVAALAIVVAIRAAAFDTSASMTSLVEAVARRLPDSVTRDRLREAVAASAPSIAWMAGQYGAGGYAAESVPLAIVAASRARELGFDGVIRDLISQGGDTDTNASMAGQIVGARLGLSRVPVALVRGVEDVDKYRELAGRLAELRNAFGR
ncbi:MAG TPA: ADP-ribosylglycohydrolase family protein [Phycisphaerae bacterium]|nr:ADP-ribosylglycohydrolase family protein [Phycisphaerae bacterium]HRW52120.1 ADP-ribosylglycohydrolase family protein [Phycisphaerae bacterium]